MNRLPPGSNPVGVSLALACVVIFWGSSFISIKLALEGFPPFMLGGLRFSIAGGILFGVALAGGYRWPTAKQWRAGAIVGTIMLAVNSSCIIFAEQTIASGLAAIGVATIPLWTALFTGILQRWPRPMEWFALGLGFCGILLLNLEGDFRASPIGALLILVTAVSWALGSVLAVRLPLPGGAMAVAVEMLPAGAIMLTASLLTGERLSAPPPLMPTLVMGYFILSSLGAFTAHAYLLRRVRPVVANSFAYTNPLVAVALGVALGGETISGYGLGAMAVVLGGLGMLTLARERT